MKFIVEYAGGHRLDITKEHLIEDARQARDFFEASLINTDAFEEPGAIPMKLIREVGEGDEMVEEIIIDGTKKTLHTVE